MTQLARATRRQPRWRSASARVTRRPSLPNCASDVYGVEIFEPLATAAAERLAALGYRNVTVRYGDGYQGWPEQAPFDVILVAAAPDHVPQPLDRSACSRRPAGDSRRPPLARNFC